MHTGLYKSIAGLTLSFLHFSVSEILDSEGGGVASQ